MSGSIDKEQSHDERKLLQLWLKPGFSETKLFSFVFVIGKDTILCVCHWEGRDIACLVMPYIESGYPILGVYAPAVVIIKLKSIANPYEVIAEARMRR